MRIISKKMLRAMPVLLVVLLLGLASDNSGQQKTDKRNRAGSSRTSRRARVDRTVRSSGSTLATDRLIVKFKSGTTAEAAEALLQYHSLSNIHRIPGVDVYRGKVPAGVTVRQMVSILKQNAEVSSAGPDYRTKIFDVPNDTYFTYYQYNLRNQGGTIDLGDGLVLTLKSGADIKASAAWDVTHGSASTIIGIVDTGVDMSHSELSGKVLPTGYDFVNDDADPTDDNSHGTWVAGIAAAATNNNSGIAGTAWNCRILPVKVMGADGTGYYSDMIEGIVYAADNGVKVINISAGGTDDDPNLETACQYAFNKGVVVVAAAGNFEEGESTAVTYPAAYDNYVLAVAATDYTDSWADFSCYGPQVDVAAPGVWILGPAPQWYVGSDYLPYVFGSGTSGASPQVAGFAALLFTSKNWLSVSQVMNIIRASADDVNKTQYSGKDNYLGYGRINMGRGIAAYKIR